MESHIQNFCYRTVLQDRQIVLQTHSQMHPQSTYIIPETIIKRRLVNRVCSKSVSFSKYCSRNSIMQLKITLERVVNTSLCIAFLYNSLNHLFRKKKTTNKEFFFNNLTRFANIYRIFYTKYEYNNVNIQKWYWCSFTTTTLTTEKKRIEKSWFDF